MGSSSHSVRITILGERDQVFSFELDPSFTIGELFEFVAAELNEDSSNLQLFYGGQSMEDRSRSLKSYDIRGDVLLTLGRSATPQPSTLGGDEQNIEAVRRLILSNDAIRSQLSLTQPALIEAARDPDSAEFLRLMRQLKDRVFGGTGPGSTTLLDRDAQQRIEEAIQQQNIMENLASAMEFHPETFGSVTMLYVAGKVNDTDIKAFVDCGAQMTVMNEASVKMCGIERLVDKRFSGIAQGVGSSKIIGRVHSVQLRLGNLFLPCSITVIEGHGGPGFLLGLDMLKRYQARIDLQEGLLTIQGISISFLPESEIPKHE